MTFLGAVLGLVVGITMGLLGGGGSILTVPIFVYVLGIAPKSAIAMSLASVGATSAIGAASHWRQGSVDLRVAGIFGGFAMVAAFAGARIARHIPETVQLVLFGVIVLTAAVLMLRNAARTPDEPLPAPPAAPDEALLDESPVAPMVPPAKALRWGWIAVQGLGVGLLTAIIGVGGGFIIVPALVLIGGLSMRQAVGTSLLVITMNAASGFAGYVGQVPIDWPVVGLFAGAAGVGILGGSKFSQHVPQRVLKQGFAVLLLVVGAYVLYRR